MFYRVIPLNCKCSLHPIFPSVTDEEIDLNTCWESGLTSDLNVKRIILFSFIDVMVCIAHDTP